MPALLVCLLPESQLLRPPALPGKDPHLQTAESCLSFGLNPKPEKKARLQGPAIRTQANSFERSAKAKYNREGLLACCAPRIAQHRDMAAKTTDKVVVVFLVPLVAVVAPVVVVAVVVMIVLVVIEAGVVAAVVGIRILKTYSLLVSGSRVARSSS